MIATFQDGGLGRVSASSGVSAGALDSFTTNLWAAYGITRQRSSTAYSGSAIRVRKSTGGDTTTEQDIGFNGAALDTGSLAAFAGSETVVVTKFYDQSGSGRDLVQATGASQPRIVNAGVYDGFVRFDGSNDWLQTSATSGAGTVFSVSTKSSYRSATPLQVTYVKGVQAQAYINGTSSQIVIYTDSSTGGDALNLFSPSFSTTKVYGYIHNAAGGTGALCSRVFDNGTELATTVGGGVNTGTFSAAVWALGASVGGGAYCAQDVYSFAIWEAQQSANMAGIAAAMA